MLAETGGRAHKTPQRLTASFSAGWEANAAAQRRGALAARQEGSACIIESLLATAHWGTYIVTNVGNL
eukprot:9072697-Pyramimonas_sp.AAC.1